MCFWVDVTTVTVAQGASCVQIALMHMPVTARTPLPTAAKRKPGRPQGSSTHAKADAPLNAEHTRIRALIQRRLARMRPHVTVTYRVLDVHFGNQHAALMARRLRLHLISKLRNDSARYDPLTAPTPDVARVEWMANGSPRPPSRSTF